MTVPVEDGDFGRDSGSREGVLERLDIFAVLAGDVIDPLGGASMQEARMD